MAISAGQLKKLELTACSIDEGHVTVEKSKTFSVMLNPSSVSLQQKISYNKTNAMGQLNSEPKFEAYPSQTMNFELMLDNTGAIVRNNPANESDDVRTQIEKLNAIVYDYNGSKHEPNHVRILWGSLIFFCRLDSMNTNFTLFKPDGDPLRASIKLSFSGYTSTEEQALTANRSSPDLTHQIMIKAGDTLPILCFKVYNDTRYYLEVARFNQLKSVNALVPGTSLHFPPLR